MSKLDTHNSFKIEHLIFVLFPMSSLINCKTLDLGFTIVPYNRTLCLGFTIIPFNRTLGLGFTIIPYNRTFDLGFTIIPDVCMTGFLSKFWQCFVVFSGVNYSTLCRASDFKHLLSLWATVDKS